VEAKSKANTTKTVVNDCKRKEENIKQNGMSKERQVCTMKKKKLGSQNPSLLYTPGTEPNQTTPSLTSDSSQIIPVEPRIALAREAKQVQDPHARPSNGQPYGTWTGRPRQKGQ
jgi:hypothetical protein